MKANSLALRLFLTAAAWVLVVLPVAGWIIFTGYRERVLATFEDQIWGVVDRIVDTADLEGATGPVVSPNVGRSVRSNSAWRWQIFWQVKPLDGKPGEILRSGSLAGEDLPLPSEHGVEPDEDEEFWADLVGPDQQIVRVAERIHQFGAGKAAQRYSVAAAGRVDGPAEDVAAFRSQLILSLALAGVGLLAATLFQVRFGLFPLSRMEQSLAAIRSGKAARLEGELPSEIRSLQQELNALLKSNQEIVERARTHVGNLAHALKTPLAVLINEARGDPSPLARKVLEQADTMTTQVNLYLDRARMAARIGVIGRVTEVGPVAESLVRALDRLYRDKELAYSLDCPDDLRFQGERHDLEEMLGNLLDNASKWARSKVSVAAMPLAADNGAAGGWLEIRVEDDGPGLTPEQLAAPIARGRRLDETKPGSGLGHSIVADLAYCYNGRFEIGRSEAGGLSARLTLPLAA
jgi:signal transduction histidine kinase